MLPPGAAAARLECRAARSTAPLSGAGHAAGRRARRGACRRGPDGAAPRPLVGCTRGRRIARAGGLRQPAAGAAGRRGGGDHQSGARESRALAHARASHRRAVVRPAHGEAVVQRQARFLAPGVRLRRRRVPARRGKARVRGRAAGRGSGLQPAPARHQRLSLARRAGGGAYRRAWRRDPAGLPPAALGHAGLYLLGRVRPGARRAARLRDTAATRGFGGDGRGPLDRPEEVASLSDFTRLQATLIWSLLDLAVAVASTCLRRATAWRDRPVLRVERSSAKRVRPARGRRPEARVVAVLVSRAALAEPVRRAPREPPPPPLRAA